MALLEQVVVVQLPEVRRVLAVLMVGLAVAVLFSIATAALLPLAVQLL